MSYGLGARGNEIAAAADVFSILFHFILPIWGAERFYGREGAARAEQRGV